MKDNEARSSVIKRLSKIEGQVRGLVRMISEERSCDEIINQIQAVKAGINKVAAIILERNIVDCLSLSENTDQTEIEKLRKLLSKIAGSK
ncbi:MAG TPA: metal-sensitive transcriptional regulator [Caldisericia bacterium]|nr:metal-sensitive transcriptional regulator [Caldisericia bacterium]OQB74170.1 MAG: Copper-sensing transcriptional repressor CsoR [bacterium ADurb.Bin132]HNY61546.1 metal-sensitive transcriptional regulator [Caldisericia bacterium]HOC79219.1 metal-sensitive transcriptional regulator [Caldisericia bacterium]HOG70520.1 metal-sensitive transcriptional regulator [Caldisericia bacterium]